ncbi:MAG: hypothetical protein VZR10_10220 [Methanobrevibacter sp.]|nr:hypothetical protein [Methanobrevibacter sp.]
MEAILKVPYNYSDPDHDFDCSEEFVFDGSMESVIKWKEMKKEYQKKMVDTYKKYRPVIDRNIHRMGHNLAINNEGEKEKTNFRQQNVYFADTKAIVRDMDNKEIYIDDLIGFYKSGEMFIIDLQLPIYEKNEELEPEIKSWIRETSKINNCTEMTDEEKVSGFTKRDLKLEFPGNKTSALLKDTKMVDIVNNHTFAFLVSEIIFLKNRE